MPHMRERVPFPDEQPHRDPDELPEPNRVARDAERPSTDALEEPEPEQVETELTNARTSEDF